MYSLYKFYVSLLAAIYIYIYIYIYNVCVCVCVWKRWPSFQGFQVCVCMCVYACACVSIFVCVRMRVCLTYTCRPGSTLLCSNVFTLIMCIGNPLVDVLLMTCRYRYCSGRYLNHSSSSNDLSAHTCSLGKVLLQIIPRSFDITSTFKELDI